MKEDFKLAVFKTKNRCNVCHEIPIIKEILLEKGINCFITSECLNHHSVSLCPLKDFASDESQFENLKCSNCNLSQTVVDSDSKLFYSCKECDKFFCDNCYNNHIIQFQKTHSVLRIDELDNICNEHYGPFTYFCQKCNINLCPLCYQREHYKHKDKILNLEELTIDEKEYNKIKSKVEEQEAHIQIITINFDKFVKLVNDKFGEYKDIIDGGANYNEGIYNSYMPPDDLNYQSILNMKRVIEIEIPPIEFGKEIEDEIYKVVQLIKSKSSHKIIILNYMACI